MRRTGLVLGAGGLLGSAWMTGALVALQDMIDRPLGELELIVGTSAGSVMGTALRCGQSVDELLAHQQGVDPDELAPDLEDVVDLPDIRRLERESGNGLPPMPWPVIGSPCLLASAALNPRRLNPIVVASSLMPRGRARMGSLVDMVTAMQTRVGVTRDGWIPGDPLWVVAVDYDSGKRTVFGRAGGPPSTVGEAVLASCSIPGWFSPQVIGGRRYVDGGIASTTSLDLLARPGAPELDEVIVLAPMASHVHDSPSDPLAQLERRLRRLLTRWLDAEIDAVRATGMRVTVLTPGPADLAAMGGNLMNPRRRERVLDTALASSRGALAAAFAASAGEGLQEGAA